METDELVLLNKRLERHASCRGLFFRPCSNQLDTPGVSATLGKGAAEGRSQKVGGATDAAYTPVGAGARLTRASSRRLLRRGCTKPNSVYP